MSDIPQRLRQLFDSIAPTLDVEHLDDTRLSFRRRWTGWQIGLVSGVAVALLVGGGLVFLSDGASDLASGQSTTTVSLTAPPPAGSQSRWDWIIAHSTPTNDENLRVADPSATPLPTFDHAALGTEQLLVIGDPATPSFDLGGGTQSVAPWVYVGTVANTAAGGYLFESDGSANAPVRTELEDGTVLPVVCLTVSVSRDVICFLDVEPTSADGLIAGVSGVSWSGLQGEVTVSMWVPRPTAIAVLNLDDGRSLVQRPVAGVALFVITDLDGAAVESAEALSASAQVIGHEDFLAQWQSLLADAELSERCQAADHVVATYQARLGGDVRFENAWMVESTDPSLEAWYFITAMVRGGPLDGQIATWQFPAFGGTVDAVNTPRLSIPANDVAASFDIGTSPALLRNVQPAAYGFSSWSEVEGFDLSQRCLGLGAES